MSFGDDVALGVKGNEILEEAGIRMMTDSEEETVDSDVFDSLVGLTLTIDEVGALHLSFSGQLECVVLKEHLNLGIIEYTLLHDLGRAQVGLAHDHIYFLAQACEVVRFLTRRVAATYDRYRFLAVEESVTGRTRTHAAATVRTLGLDAEVLGTRAGSDDNRIGFIEVCVFDPDFMGYG